MCTFNNEFGNIYLFMSANSRLVLETPQIIPAVLQYINDLFCLDF